MTMKCDEEMIEVAVKHIGHEFLAELAGNTEGDFVVSESFDKKMHALIGRKAARRTGRSAMKMLTRVAAVLFVIIVVFSVAVVSSEALRSRVISLLYEVGGGKAQISFGVIGTEKPIEGMVIPDYLPRGYELVKTDVDGQLILSQYENEAGNSISIQQTPLDTHIEATQDGAYQMQIAGRTVYVIDQADYKTVIFSNDWYCFIIFGEVELSDLLAITESILT